MRVVASPLTGIVVELLAAPGAAVRAGAPVAIIESMKMHHEVSAPVEGVIRDHLVEPGASVLEGDELVAIETGIPRTDGPSHDPRMESPEGSPKPGGVRADLAEAMRRRELTRDEARPDAVAKRRELGRRTARENVADLCDEGSFSEYGALAIAAQRARRELDDLLANTPGDGMVCGLGTVNSEAFGEEAARCVVLAYDYTVLAGTQGLRNHRKTDRLIELAERLRAPIVLFAEGGGGRPGDTDQSELFHLVVPTFRNFARLSGLVPRIGIVSGRCFAGNAALLGCCDLVIATPDASVGMGGPAMIEGGGLGSFSAEEVGPVEALEPAGVIDLVVGDEQAAVAAARRLLAYFQGPVEDWDCADQALLRDVVPAERQRVHDAHRLLELLADTGSVLEVRPGFGRTMITALARIEGRPIGVIANDPAHLSGAIDAAGSEKAARFLQLCDAFGLPVLSLVDTPGFMVGPESERTGMVRRCSRLFLAAATMSSPVLMVVVRRAYGLGAQAMAGGDFHAPLLNVSWPTGEFGAMGIEGAVRLALRRELEAIEDDAEREQRVADLVETVREQSGALNMATFFEIDDVIDPAETRERIVRALRSWTPAPPGADGRRRTMIDSW